MVFHPTNWKKDLNKLKKNLKTKTIKQLSEKYKFNMNFNGML